MSQTQQCQHLTRTGQYKPDGPKSIEARIQPDYQMQFENNVPKSSTQVQSHREWSLQKRSGLLQIRIGEFLRYVHWPMPQIVAKLAKCLQVYMRTSIFNTIGNLSIINCVSSINLTWDSSSIPEGSGMWLLYIFMKQQVAIKQSWRTSLRTNLCRNYAKENTLKTSFKWKISFWKLVLPETWSWKQMQWLWGSLKRWTRRHLNKRSFSRATYFAFITCSTCSCSKATSLKGSKDRCFKACARSCAPACMQMCKALLFEQNP